jgi:hypothetical protein
MSSALPSAQPPQSGGGLQRQRLRPLRTPSPVPVQVGPQGLPVSVKRRGRHVRVEAVRERWRIDDEWWRNPISREYFALVLEDGRPVIVFRDLVTGEWFSQ